MDLHDQVVARLHQIGPSCVRVSRVGRGRGWEIYSDSEVRIHFESSSGPVDELDQMLDVFQDVVMWDTKMRWPDADHDTSPEVQTRPDGSVSRIGYSYPLGSGTRMWVAFLDPSREV